MNSPIHYLFGNERVSFLATGVSLGLTFVCSETSPKSEFNSLIRRGSETSARTNCMNSLLGNFYYNMTATSGVNTCSGISNSLLTVCNDRQTLIFNVSLCASTTPVMFSATGTLGCLSVIQDGSTYYSGLYNYDITTPNGFTTYQFTCIMVTTSAVGTVNVNAKAKRCSSSQTTTTRQSGEELYAMMAYETCPFTSDSSGTDVLPIILGVIFGVLFIIVPTITAFFYYKKKMKQRIQVTFKVLDKRTAKNGIAVEHPFNYPSLPVYIVAVKRSPKGMTLNQPKHATDSDHKPTVSGHARKQSPEKSPEIATKPLETDKMEPTTLRLSTTDADVKHKEEPSTDSHLTSVENTEEQYH